MDGIANTVWEVLKPHEQKILFAIEDCSIQRFGPEEMRRRLDEIERLRINWVLHDAGKPML